MKESIRKPMSIIVKWALGGIGGYVGRQLADQGEVSSTVATEATASGMLTGLMLADMLEHTLYPAKDMQSDSKLTQTLSEHLNRMVSRTGQSKEDRKVDRMEMGTLLSSEWPRREDGDTNTSTPTLARTQSAL